MKNELTSRQLEILTFIKESLNANGYAPTYREICAHFNIASTFGVKRHIDALVKKGYLTSESNLSRALSVIQNEDDKEINYSEDIIELPLIGRVAAGFPILAQENIEDTIAVHKNFIKNSKNCFVLKVKGDSMINAGIFEGDLVIVNQQNSVNNNDIVVGLLGDEATLKRFVKIQNRHCLMPENDKYPLIEINNREDFSIIGKVVAVLRFYN